MVVRVWQWSADHCDVIIPRTHTLHHYGHSFRSPTPTQWNVNWMTAVLLEYSPTAWQFKTVRRGFSSVLYYTKLKLGLAVSIGLVHIARPDSTKLFRRAHITRRERFWEYFWRDAVLIDVLTDWLIDWSIVRLWYVDQVAYTYSQKNGLTRVYRDVD